MKIATIVARVLLGLIYTAFSLAFFFNLMPQQELSGATLQFVTGLAASGYIMYVVKGLELACGVLLLSGRFASLAAVVIFPITVNIFLFHAFLAPDNMAMSVIMLIANVFLGYAYRERYNGMLAV